MTSRVRVLCTLITILYLIDIFIFFNEFNVNKLKIKKSKKINYFDKKYYAPQ